ncbi:MAG: membrane integrity-associated transporter subunit PqiC [Nitrospirota bacterium]|nr:MAG: membrane integrity-associated transporter subunit PqiC [Nitrospirota bacterium]
MKHFLNTRVFGFSHLLAPLLALALTGCGLMGSAPPPTMHTFILDGEMPSETLPTVTERAGKGVLLVNVPRANAGFSTPRMAYSVREHEVNYFTQNQWANTPAQMLHPLLVQALERTKIWETVVRMPSTVRGDFQLDTENLELLQEFIQQPSRVRLKLRMQLIELRGHRPIGTREFSVLEEAPDEDPYGGVLAANRAVTELLKQLTDWLTTCMSEPELGKC